MDIIEQYRQDLWRILQSITHNQLYFERKGEPSFFKFSEKEWADIKITENQLLERLQEWGVIKDLKYDPEKNNSTFIIIQPAFNKIYVKLKSLVGDVENKIAESDTLLIELKSGQLVVNKDTGFVRLNDVANEFNTGSKEFNAVLKLATSKNYKATYEELLGKNPSKVNIRGLGFTIRNVKKCLGILPQKTAQNENIIKCNKGVGYRLII